jgi:hypothetical protein
MRGVAVHQLETEPEGRHLAQRLRGLPNSARRQFCAAVCESALLRVDLAIPALVDALPDVRSGTATEARRAAVASVVHELDVAAWDLADRDDPQYGPAFQRARAAAAVEEALRTSDTAALETAYEAFHAGLALTDIAGLLDGPSSRT